MATLQRNHEAICNIADVRYIRFHDLKHTCATLLLEQGVELVTIKELLGHAQIHTTADVYSHVRVRMQRHAIESMGKALESTHDSEDEDDWEEEGGDWDDEDGEPDDPPLAVSVG